MTCKWCGSGRHSSEKCPTLNLVNYLLDREYDEDNLPDLVTVMDADDLLAMNEKQLHDEVKQINKLKKS